MAMVDADGSCHFFLADSQSKSVGLVWGLAATSALSLHSSNEPGELSQWLCHDDSTINIISVITIIIIIIIIIIAELWRLEVARPGNFVSNFCVFWKNDPLKLSLLHGSRPKSARASPHIWLTLFRFQISSKSVHFWQSYCQTREDRCCPVEYLQYTLFEPITRGSVIIW